MTNNEIDRRLALAIGYTADSVMTCSDGIYCLYVVGRHSKYMRLDHTDPAVIWPIAKRFDAFPQWRYNGKCEFIGWHCWAFCRGYGANENPATASALAIIKYVESMK